MSSSHHLLEFSAVCKHAAMAILFSTLQPDGLQAHAHGHCHAMCRDYIIQDHKYLHTYAMNLNALASKAHDPSHAQVFTRSAMAIYQEELSLHAKLLKDWGLDEADVEATEMQPPCFTYTHFLSSVASTRPFHEGLAPAPPEHADLTPPALTLASRPESETMLSS